ncbi:MAG: winged helix-turn-helix domain-containing protein, partial [Gemmatimonadaceae bacterium]
MAIPDFQTCMLPMLQLAADGREHSLADAREALAAHFDLTDEDRTELLPSGRQHRFDNRVGWARRYLDKAGLLESPRRAHFRVTERGGSVLANPPSRIDIGFLEQFEEFREFPQVDGRSTNVSGNKSGATSTPPDETPEEVLERAYQMIRSELATELLAKVKSSSPAFFERLVVELLLKMGYGRSRAEAGRA